MACKVSVEKSADSFMGVSLYNCFSLAAFKILSFSFNLLHFNYDGSWCKTLCTSGLNVCFLHQVMKIFSHYFFQIGFKFLALSLLPAPSCERWYGWSGPRGSLHYPHFFEFFFLFAILNGCFFLLPKFRIANFFLSFISCTSSIVSQHLFQLVYFWLVLFHAVEVFTKFIEHPYNQCFELCLHLEDCLSPFCLVLFLEVPSHPISHVYLSHHFGRLLVFVSIN